MIGLLAQNHHLSDQLVLFFSGESLSQLDFRAPTPDQLTFAAFDCAGLLAVNFNDWRRIRTVRQMFKLKQSLLGLVGFRVAGRENRLVSVFPELICTRHGAPSAPTSH